MSIDGFLQFLGLVVAIFALASPVSKFRFRLHGAWLWAPSTFAILAIIYLLFFDQVSISCTRDWCALLTISNEAGLTPSKLAFVVVLLWLGYVATLSTRKLFGKRQLPLMSKLVDRLEAERRFSELADFVEPQLPLIIKCANRSLPRQKLVDRVRWQHSIFLPPRDPTKSSRLRITRKIEDWALPKLKWCLPLLQPDERFESAAAKILRSFHTNDALIQFMSIDRPMMAIRLMETGAYDYDYSDRSFEVMMNDSQSQFRREIILNQNTELCFYVIDSKNEIISHLFSKSAVAQRLEVWRPVGNNPLTHLDRNIGNYRNVISSAKPIEDKLIHDDRSYAMIRFFDIMVRSAMRDGIKWHMWLFYLDLLVEKIVSKMDRSNSEYDETEEFPNFGYYLIYEVFSVYGSWLKAVDCCEPNSPAIEILSTEPRHENGSILKSTMLSIGNSMRRLVESDTPDRFVTYILEVVLRSYRDLGGNWNGATLRLAMAKSVVGRGYYGPSKSYVERLAHCYEDVDHCLRAEVEDFQAVLNAAL